MIGIPLGLLAANATEWLVHRHVLHGLGKKRESWWSFHWHDHHRSVRQNDHYDEDYAQPLHRSEGMWKEALALAAGAAAVAPLLPVAPFFVGAVWYSTVDYYRKHKRSHLDPEWARQHLSWHYDHHMGPNQNSNWCVTRPWFDDLMGTREVYVGTEREARDIARKADRAGKVAAAGRVDEGSVQAEQAHSPTVDLVRTTG
jgi:sterol desaturase/sphingolipid hydroxylase (fatty acid hydroxylase superfamily)